MSDTLQFVEILPRRSLTYKEASHPTIDKLKCVGHSRPLRGRDISLITHYSSLESHLIIHPCDLFDAAFRIDQKLPPAI